MTADGHGSAIDIPAADNTGIKSVHSWNRLTYARAREAPQETVASAAAAPSSDVMITMKPLWNFSMNSKYVALCYLKNLRIGLTGFLKFPLTIPCFLNSSALSFKSWIPSRAISLCTLESILTSPTILPE